MIKLAMNYEVSSPLQIQPNRYEHYWWRVRKAGKVRFKDQWLWMCKQCGTKVLKVQFGWGQDRPDNTELEEAAIELNCCDQTVAMVMSS